LDREVVLEEEIIIVENGADAHHVMDLDIRGQVLIKLLITSPPRFNHIKMDMKMMVLKILIPNQEIDKDLA
jgi:hypothetical protein